MGEQTATLAAETKALKEAYAALNRNDIPAMLTAFDPELEWSDPPSAPGAGTYRGLAVVQAHLSRARSTWAEGSCEPERFIVAGDKIVVFVHVHVRLKGATDWIEARMADVCTFRNGLAVQMRSFEDRRQALEWAGAPASAEN